MSHRISRSREVVFATVATQRWPRITIGSFCPHPTLSQRARGQRRRLFRPPLRQAAGLLQTGFAATVTLMFPDGAERSPRGGPRRLPARAPIGRLCPMIKCCLPWTQSVVTHNEPLLLHQIFAAVARQHADRVAVEVPPGRSRPQRLRVTYAELGRQADAVASALRRWSAATRSPPSSCRATRPRCTRHNSACSRRAQRSCAWIRRFPTSTCGAYWRTPAPPHWSPMRRAASVWRLLGYSERRPRNQAAHSGCGFGTRSVPSTLAHPPSG